MHIEVIYKLHWFAEYNQGWFPAATNDEAKIDNHGSQQEGICKGSSLLATLHHIMGSSTAL